MPSMNGRGKSFLRSMNTKKREFRLNSRLRGKDCVGLESAISMHRRLNIAAGMIVDWRGVHPDSGMSWVLGWSWLIVIAGSAAGRDESQTNSSEDECE